MDFATPSQAIQRNFKFLGQDIAAAAKLAAGKELVPYIGLVGYRNLGDDVLYQAYKELFPGSELMPYRRDSIVVEKFATLIQRKFFPYAMLGGGTLINDGDVWLAKAEHLVQQGSRMFCFGTGAESSEFYGSRDESSELLERWVRLLDKFEFVGVRGPRSKAILKSAGAKNVQILGDTALALTKERLRPRRSKGIVGITYGDVPGNPMWGNPQTYRSELKKVIKAIINSGSEVLLLPIWEIDVSSNKSLIKEINHPKCRMVEAYDSYISFSNKLRECDIFIGQKLHSTILAYMNRVPAIMIEYRPKCRDFMASLDLEEYVIKTSEFQLKPFLQMYDRLQKNYSSIYSKSESRILEYKHLQFEEATMLRRRLNISSGSANKKAVR